MFKIKQGQLAALSKNGLLRLNQKQAIKPFDIAIFLRQLANLLAASIPIDQCCNMLEKSQTKTKLRLLIHSIKRDITAGIHLSVSLRRHPEHFDDLICQLIKIGEHTGSLDTMLLRIANNAEQQLAVQRRIKQALFYPSIIFSTAMMITFSMLVFVIPRFAELFRDTHATLPALTTAIFYLSSVLRANLWLVLTLITSLLLLTYRSKPSTRQIIHRYLYGLPLIKQYQQKLKLTRFARHLAMTISAGMPLTEALSLLSHSPSIIDTASIKQLRSKISSGLQLHCAMESIPYFPTLMIQMIKVGEDAGCLDYMLNKMADLFDTELDQQLNELTQILEPLIMIVLGVLIGGLVIGMYLPIFKLGSAV